MVTSTGSKIQYTGNGATTSFAFNFLVTDQAHLVVIKTVRRR